MFMMFFCGRGAKINICLGVCLADSPDILGGKQCMLSPSLRMLLLKITFFLSVKCRL